MDYVPDIGIMYAPYLTDTYDENFALVDSPWFKKQMEKVAGHGFEIVTAKWIYGDRQLLANKPVKPRRISRASSPDAQHENSLQDHFLHGRHSTPMPLRRGLSGDRAGVIDGAETPTPSSGRETLREGQFLTRRDTEELSMCWAAHKYFAVASARDRRIYQTVRRKGVPFRE